MFIRRLFIWLFSTLAIAVVSLRAYDLPEIHETVTTEFGVYEPVAVDIEPAVGDVTVAEDFSNVAFFENFSSSFDSEALEILARNHFVAVPGRYKQIHDLYNWAEEADLPRFVTTDCLLHTFHIIYDYALRILETERFQHDLMSLNEALLADLRLRSSTDPTLAEELRRVVAFAAVARKLARPESDVPEEAADLVAAEMALIQAHEGPEGSPILGYREDYSQYVPRGHYTRSRALENYFRAMMWYGRLGFRLRPGEEPEEIEKGRSETRMALNVVASLSGLDVEGEPAIEVWERIYRPTVFFVGSADDLTASEYAELAGEVYGKAVELLTPEEIAESVLLQNFIDQAMELRPPRINSSLLIEGDASVVTKGFRVMGQRFIPDSYVLWKLVDPNVNGRLMPRGLDVMAVLGSQEAERLLDETYREFANPDYGVMLDSLKQEFAAFPAATWAENLYWNWLYCLRPLFAAKGVGYPTFMRAEAWRRKELGTALGSWAQLRHDTILYAKQSYTFETSIPVPGEELAGYVEPEPEVFARLSALARYMRRSLAERGILPDEISWRLAQFESLALSLKQIAEKELEAQDLNEADAGVIRTIGKTLEHLVSFPAEETSAEIQSETDEEMAVIADVHTDPNTLSALEVGVGYPLVLYVIVPTASGPVMTVGGMFSYYEFTHPISDRLTDEVWQEMLRIDSAPEPAEWLGDFLSLGEQGSVEYASFPCRDQSVSPRLDLPAGTIRPGDELEIRVETHGGESLSVRFWAGDNLIAETGLSLDPSGGDVHSAIVSTSGWPAGVVRAELIRDGQSGGSTFFELALAAAAATDLNSNGRTEITDLIELLRRLARGEAPDINGDGRGDVFDLIDLLRILSSQSNPEARMTALGPCQGEGVRSLTGCKLELEAEGGKVSFVHSGATYNCCMDSISVMLEMVAENHLRIIETEYTANPCRCICDYTVFGEITGLSSGTYTVEVVSAAEPKIVLCSSMINVP